MDWAWGRSASVLPPGGTTTLLLEREAQVAALQALAEAAGEGGGRFRRHGGKCRHRQDPVATGRDPSATWMLPTWGEGRAARGDLSLWRSVLLRDLNQVAAGVVEDGRRHLTHLRRLLRELNTERREARELLLDVVDGKGCEGNSVADERRLEWFRGRVIDQIGMPWWYWWGLAAAWVGLGVASDVANPWVTSAAMLTFGAVHSFVSTWVLAGRQRTSDVRVRAEVAGRRAPALIFGFLVGLGAVTVAVALLAYADGAGHPATMASVFVAVAILLGGHRLMAAIRTGAIRRAAAG
jgi:hypothetical protein